jgi:hypothetical protein
MHGTGMIRIGGVNHLVEERFFDQDLQTLISDRETGEKLREIDRQAFEDLQSIFERERFREINAEMNRASMESRDQRREAEFAPVSNFMGPREHFIPSQALPRSPGASDVAIVLQRLALDEGWEAIIRTLNDDRATAWQAAYKQAQRDILAPQQQSGSDDDPEVTRAAFARYRRALDEFVANEAQFADSLRAALEGIADDAVNLLTLCRTWTYVSSAPPRVPPPIGKAAVVGSIGLHLDRVSAMHTLLQLDLPMDRLSPGVVVIARHTPEVARASEVYRRAVLDVMEAGQLANILGRAGDHVQMQESWKVQASAAMAARQARIDVLRIMRAMHAEVIAALDREAAELYRRAVQRIACPSAVGGVDGALAMFDRAARLAPEQHGQIDAIRAELDRELVAAANAIEGLITEYVAAHDYTLEAEAKCADIYARLEHAMFIKDETCSAAPARVRPLLTAVQMHSLQERAAH